MDDLSKRLEALLSDPDSMGKITAMLGALGGAGGTGGGPVGSPEASEPVQEVWTPEPSAEKASPSAPPIDMSLLFRLAPLLSGLGGEDQNTVLLKALRPYLHGDRVDRLDNAIQMMRLVQFLPFLQGELGGSGHG